VENQHFIGIDLGSTAAKVVVLGTREWRFVLPAGWSSLATAAEIRQRLESQGIDLGRAVVVATGYGRGAVKYATRQITEITCHGAGCAVEYPDCTVIDIGGQDTKIIWLSHGKVTDFLMNDKCSAGTGKFVEIMANRLEVEIDTLFTLAESGSPLVISSLCTVFAESEIIGQMAAGRKREDIAAGVVDSVAAKVAGLALQRSLRETVLLTGGLSHLPFFAACLSRKLRHPVLNLPQGRFSGAYGAALLARETSEVVK
jgi:predicted CoA-substrate-specific enzyme activase